MKATARSNRISILDQKLGDVLDEFLSLCKAVGANADRLNVIARQTVRYLRGTAEARDHLRSLQNLEARWYASLENCAPDYGVYAVEDYLAELWACWVVYSREYLKGIRDSSKLPSEGGIASAVRPAKLIVDLGCGCGLTTAALTSIFPASKVVGTNLSGTAQWRIAEEMSERYGFDLIESASGLNADLVFASEYFEHFPKPIEHLREVLAGTKPKHMLVANAFGAVAIGHFKEYDVDGELLPGEQTHAAFTAEMEANDYGKIKTKLWNNRPTYWRKKA